MFFFIDIYFIIEIIYNEESENQTEESEESEESEDSEESTYDEADDGFQPKLSGAPTRKVSDILRYNLELAKNSSRADDKREEREQPLNSASGKLDSSRGQGSMLPYRKSTDQDIKLQEIKSSRSKTGSSTDRSSQKKQQLEQVSLPAINGAKKSSRESSKITQNSGAESQKIGEKEYTDE